MINYEQSLKTQETRQDFVKQDKMNIKECTGLQMLV